MCKPTHSKISSLYKAYVVDTTSYSKVGNLFHILTLLNVLAYAILVLKFADHAIFDDQWRSQGFCVMNIDEPYWNSHDLCLYFDTVAAVAVMALYLALHKETPTQGMKSVDALMKWQGLSVLMHGFAHGMISYGLRQAGGKSSDLSSTMPASTKFLVGLVFWFPMIKSFMDELSLAAVLAMSLLVTGFSNVFVPDLFGFMYVQTVIGVMYAYQQLLQPKKDKENFAYMIFAFITLPISIIPWFESMSCASWFMQYGGHVLYDIAIPVSLSAAYITCWWRDQSVLIVGLGEKKLV
jgi:hypothetical protein